MATYSLSRRYSLVYLSAAALAVLTACGGSDGPTAEPSEQFVPPEPPSGYTAKAIAYADRDMVSAANPLAVQAGVAIFARGGSAVEQKACAPDVSRYCRAVMNESDLTILGCLQAHRAKISKKCDKVLLSHGQ